jgi:hypothetical protein
MALDVSIEAPLSGGTKSRPASVPQLMSRGWLDEHAEKSRAEAASKAARGPASLGLANMAGRYQGPNGAASTQPAKAGVYGKMVASLM